MKSLLLLLVLTGFTCGSAISCKDESPTIQEPEETDGFNWENHRPFQASYMADLLPFNASYQTEPINIGPLQLDESSGVCSSVKNPGMLWTHEDSGNVNFIFLVDAATAEIVCRYRVVGATNQDWEDIEIAKDATSGIPYLYIADTGDNDERRQPVTVYKFEEPSYTPANRGMTVDIDASTVQRINVRYPDGSHDVEGMFVDPETSDVYFVTKRDAASKVYVMPYPYSVSETNHSYWVGDLGFREASAATMNLQGNKVIIRNRQNIFYWERQANEAIWQMLSRTPERLPYVGEVQGEAVCFNADDNYYTTSERASLSGYPPIYKYIKR